MSVVGPDDGESDDHYLELAHQNRVWPYGADDPANWELVLEQDQRYLEWLTNLDNEVERRQVETEQRLRAMWRADGNKLKELVTEQASTLDLTGAETDELWEERLRALIHAPRWGMCLWCSKADSAYRSGLCRACAAYRRKYGRLRTTNIIDHHQARVVEREINQRRARKH